MRCARPHVWILTVAPRIAGVHEWFLWKLVLTPLARFLPTEYSSIDLLKQLTEVMTPDWSVLREVKARLSFTWVSP